MINVQIQSASERVCMSMHIEKYLDTNIHKSFPFIHVPFLLVGLCLLSIFICFPECIGVLYEGTLQAEGRPEWWAGREAPTSLMRAMKRFPKRQGLCRLHCNELTVICWDCCTATATTCTASYISAASVYKSKKNTRERSRASLTCAAHNKSLLIDPKHYGSVHNQRNINIISWLNQSLTSKLYGSASFNAVDTVAMNMWWMFRWHIMHW